MELIALAFFAFIGVILMKLLAGGDEQPLPPPPMPPAYGPSQGPYGGMAPYPPMEGYYAPKPIKRKVIIVPETKKKRRSIRRRKI